MSHNCDEASRQLYQYLDDELDQLTAARIRVHLEECSGCFGSFEFERRLKGVIRSHLEEDMPETLVASVRELIREEQAQERL